MQMKHCTHRKWLLENKAELGLAGTCSCKMVPAGLALGCLGPALFVRQEETGAPSLAYGQGT